MAEAVARYLTNLACLVKLEVSYGTDSTPTGMANAMQMVDVTLTPMDGTEVERGLLKPYMGHQGVILTGGHVSLQGSVELVGSGDPGTPPPYAALLRACGLAETITPDTDVTYNPISGAFEAASLYYNLDGVRHIALGVRGSLTLSLVPQQIPRIVFSMKGLAGTISDTALPTADFDGWIDPLPVNKLNTQMSLHGWTAIAESLSLDLAHTVTPRLLIGEESIKISNRKTTGSAVVQATSLATKNWFGIAGAHTKGALHVQHGNADGNIVEIDAPKVQIGRPTQGGADNIANYTLPLMLTPDAGNDELVLTFR